MNIKYIQEFLSKISEIKIIGKSAIINDVVCNVAAIVRYDMELRLIILEYDEQFRDQIEESEIAELCEVIEKPKIRINRDAMKENRVKPMQPFSPIKSLSIGDLIFQVNGVENRRLSYQDGESVLVISELLRNGWNPKGIDYQNINMIFLTSIKLIGEYTKIPEIDINLPFHFTMRNETTSYFLEKPITLTVNGEYPEKLWFKNKDTGEEHWAQINRVYLYDMWSGMEKTFSDLKLLNHMTKEQIDDAKIDFEKKFLEICPKDMLYPIVEYECDESITLQFYTKEFLNSKPISRNYSMGFGMRSDNSTGKLGLKLKTSIIQEPMPENTETIDAELFQYNKTITPSDIII